MFMCFLCFFVAKRAFKECHRKLFTSEFVVR